MKTSPMLLSMFAAVALITVALLNPPAHAAPPPVQQALLESAQGASKFSVNLTWDAGATGVTQVKCLSGANQTVRLEAVRTAAMPYGNQFCYKVCSSSTCAPDCTKDLVLNVPQLTYQTPDSGVSQSGFTFTAPPAPWGPIQMGTDTCIVVSSLDAGNPNINLYNETSNLVR